MQILTNLHKTLTSILNPKCDTNSNMLSFQLTLIHLPHQTSTSIHCKPEENHTQLITLNIHFKINNNYNTTKTGEDGTGTAAAITTTGTISVLLNSC